MAYTYPSRHKLPAWPGRLKEWVKENFMRIIRSREEKKPYWAAVAIGFFEALRVLEILQWESHKVCNMLALKLIESTDFFDEAESPEAGLDFTIKMLQRVSDTTESKSAVKYLENLYQRIQEVTREKTDEERNPWRNHPVTEGDQSETTTQ